MADLVDGLGGIAGFGENHLEPNDDESSVAIDITGIFPGGLNFFGTVYEALYLNNNGNITFESPLSTFTPFGIIESTRPIIAAYFADVDTRGDEAELSPTPGGTSQGTDLVWYDFDTQNGVFTVTWDDVGVYSSDLATRNAFQLQLVDRGGGDFDIVFRYEEVEWTVGSASGDTDARIGYSAGDQRNYSELAASGNRAALLGLPDAPGLGSPTRGVVVYEVRGGVVQNPDEDDTPAGGHGIIDDPDDPDDDGGVPPDEDVEGEVVAGTRADDVLTGTYGNDTIGGGAGRDAIHGGAGDDVIKGGRDSDGIDAGAGDDLVRGNAGDDRIVGDTGDDTLLGGNGDDTLIGRGGDDLIRGGLGDDVIIGGRGRDVVTGEAGADTFVLYAAEGQSRILDFEVDVDLIGLDNGLTFADLSFDGDRILAGEEVLAVLVGVDTAALSASDFTVL
ncbi:calcium-binding protein [Acuticoccus sp. I52.16.1]|uniref:calcium-binding protein n=1 Tax=Acuticoccus sp. I52.16.1 TaxID=2928472 RepID=UPI001FD4E53D|nr:nidogen-like domain-containing protein [Acuticoccus sp. I52.16.1]UOM33273.1 hypothetical protein MRB58_15555 [Acuticoccus sp. I52.16.1]